MVKYVVVTGGVLSGIGKGIVASSTGVLLKAMGLRVTSIKIDPYINIDAGTMSPFEHGEVYVLDDGGEVDLDLGNYERFLDVTLSRDNNITTGKIYNTVIERERKGEYLGKTVQVVPHIVNTIQEWIHRVSRIPADGQLAEPDVCVIELGGTIGDIESMPFVEALRQFAFKVGPENFCAMHVSLVPVVGAVGEQKTKPTQHSVREIRALGIAPDIVVCRSSQPLEADTKYKLAMFCQVASSNVISVHDVSNTYKVPLLLEQQHLSRLLISKLKLDALTQRSDLIDSGALQREPVFGKWQEMAEELDVINDAQTESVTIAMVGKYTGLSDSYLSVLKSLQHAALKAKRRLVVSWIVAGDLEEATKGSDAQAYDTAWDTLKKADGILVPGGFGDRGVEGKIAAAHYARVNKVPYLGICLGLQIAVIEWARSVLGWADATSEEFDNKTAHNVVVFMPEISKTIMGGTMRLGLRQSLVRAENSLSEKLYGTKIIHERHRHRYEVNPKLVPQLETQGLKFVAQDETGERMEIVELDRSVHPYFLATQYHPEFKSRPLNPSPPFVGLLFAASGQLDAFLASKQ